MRSAGSAPSSPSASLPGTTPERSFPSNGHAPTGVFVTDVGRVGIVLGEAMPSWMLRLVNRIPWNWRYTLTTVCAALMIVDCGMTLMSLDRWYQREAGVAPDNAILSRFIDDPLRQSVWRSVSRACRSTDNAARTLWQESCRRCRTASAASRKQRPSPTKLLPRACPEALRQQKDNRSRVRSRFYSYAFEEGIATAGNALFALPSATSSCSSDISPQPFGMNCLQKLRVVTG